MAPPPRARCRHHRPYYSAFPTLATINQVSSGANSQYQGFVASLRTQGYHGVTAKFNYTVGHSKDDASSIRGVNPTNSRDLRFDYGDSDFDIRHTFTSYITYELPSPKRMKLLLGGWQVNSLMSFHSAAPFTVYAGQNFSGTFEGKTASMFRATRTRWITL